MTLNFKTVVMEFGWYMRSKVVLFEEMAGSALQVVNFQLIDYGDLLADIDVYVLDSRVTLSGLTDEDFSYFGCERMGKMARAVFGDCERINMLKYRSRRCGRLKNVKRLYWVESFWMYDNVISRYVLDCFLDYMSVRVFANQGVLIFGFDPGIEDVFEILEERGFRDMVDLDCRFVSHSRTGWELRYEMFLSE